MSMVFWVFKYLFTNVLVIKLVIFFNYIVFFIPYSNCFLVISFFIAISFVALNCVTIAFLAELKIDFGIEFLGGNVLDHFELQIWKLKLYVVLSFEFKTQDDFVLGFKTFFPLDFSYWISKYVWTFLKPEKASRLFWKCCFL